MIPFAGVKQLMLSGLCTIFELTDNLLGSIGPYIITLLHYYIITLLRFHILNQEGKWGKNSEGVSKLIF